jgi:hypothetical protein
MRGTDREMAIEMFKDIISHTCTLPVSKDDLALLSDMDFYPLFACGKSLMDAYEKAWQKPYIGQEETNSLFLFVWAQDGLEGIMDEFREIEKSLGPRKIVYGMDYDDSIEGVKLLLMTSCNHYPEQIFNYIPNLEIIEDDREMIIQETVGVIKIENENEYVETIVY